MFPQHTHEPIKQFESVSVRCRCHIDAGHTLELCTRAEHKSSLFCSMCWHFKYGDYFNNNSSHIVSRQINHTTPCAHITQVFAMTMLKKHTRIGHNIARRESAADDIV